MWVMKLSLVVCTALVFAPVLACGASDEGEGDSLVGAESSALASECSSVLPTWIGGRVYGEDGRAIDALMGISFTTASGGHLDKNGTLPCEDAACTTYSVVQHVNPTLPDTGGPAAGNVSTWGKCVGTPTSKVWIEVYPRGKDGKTSFARYGAAVDNRAIKRGVANGRTTPATTAASKDSRPPARRLPARTSSRTSRPASATRLRSSIKRASLPRATAR